MSEAAYLALARARERCEAGVRALLASHGLSAAQYNVLRIVRGAGPDGLSCRDVGERLLTRGPDVSRLLDRMEPQGWIERVRAAADRRVVRIRLLPAGHDLVGGLDAPVSALHAVQFAQLSDGERRLLEGLLDRVASG